jgi:hypothetical protein
MNYDLYSPKLEEYLKQLDLEKAISFMRSIFKFTYTKSRSDDGVYIWFGDKDWDMKSKCPIAHVGYCSFIFIDYTEDQVIEKYNKYFSLKAFL